MGHLTADDRLVIKELATCVEPVEIRDVNGKLLGLFIPANLERAEQLRAEALARIDLAELERRKQSKGPRHTLQEGLTWLGRLEDEMERRKTAGEKQFTTEEALAFFRSLRQSSPARGPGTLPANP
jgi:hypothetical protein